MTTTPNPTAEQIADEVFTEFHGGWPTSTRDANDRAAILAAAERGLSAHGLLSEGAVCEHQNADYLRMMRERDEALEKLSEGAPSEEQIERAAKALYDLEDSQAMGPGWVAETQTIRAGYRRMARSVLSAAGVAPREPSDNAVRDAIDHIRGAVEFQDTISPEAVRVLTDAAILDRPKIQDPATTTLVAEAREWAKYDSTGASKIVIELCNALTAAGAAQQEFQESSEVEIAAEQISNRERLIADAKAAIRRCSFASGADHATIFNAIDALAAQPVLDPEKVRQRVMNALPYTVEVSEPNGPAVYAHRTERGARQEARAIMDALCEAYTEGKLT